MSQRAMVLFLAGSLLCCAGAKGRAPPADPDGRAEAERAIRDAERAWTRAVLDGDADRFASFLTGDFVELTQSGKLLDKAALVGSVSDRTARYSAMDYQDLRIRFAGPGVAIVTGFLTTTRPDRPEPTHRSLVVETWVKIEGRWQTAASALARAPPAAKE